MEELQEHTRPHTSEWLRKGLKVKVRQSVSAKLVWVARNNRQQQRGKAEADQKQREPTHGAGELLIWLIDVPSAVHIVKSLTDCETHKESPSRSTPPSYIAADNLASKVLTKCIFCSKLWTCIEWDRQGHVSHLVSGVLFPRWWCRHFI